MLRRNFLKTSAVLGGIAMTNSVLTLPKVHAGGDDVIKIALVGCGGRGRGALLDRLAVGDRVSVVALADVFDQKANLALEALEEAKEKYVDHVSFDQTKTYSGFDAYKKAIDSCDQVILATPPGFRPLHYRYAVEQGKHVFMEKPCCVDAPGFRSLMESNKVADEKGLTVVVGFQRRYDPAYLEFVQKCFDGFLGEIMYSALYWQDRSIWEQPRQEGDTEMMYQLRNWYHFPWLSADQVAEQMVHNIDVGNWIHGKGDPLAHPVLAYGSGGRLTRRFPRFRNSGYRYDHYCIEFRYADGSRMFGQCRHFENTAACHGEHFIGTKCNSAYNIIYKNGTNEELWRFTGEEANPYKEEHKVQAHAIRNGLKHNDGWSGATSSFTGYFARAAAMSGDIIAWDDLVAHGKAEFPPEGINSWEQLPPIMPDTVPPALPGPGELIYENSVPIPGVWSWKE
ncbi:MAG: Gfo/Idh/MocA family oxidoreductase [Planctomycetia bacterium]|nr:Gfo/Idh/MocA family oxidoreductase [Planctomycetia bacterium]